MLTGKKSTLNLFKIIYLSEGTGIWKLVLSHSKNEFTVVTKDIVVQWIFIEKDLQVINRELIGLLFFPVHHLKGEFQEIKQ